MRLAVYTDYAYRGDGDGRIFAERAFATFVAGLAPFVDSLVVAGRLNPRPGRSHYELPPAVEFAALPHYESLTRPLGALRAASRSLAAFWRLLDGVDAVWVLGPQGLALPFALLAAWRRTKLTLGARQDLPRYVHRRWPGRRWIHLTAVALDWAFRRLARRYPIVVVGPDLAHRYGDAPRLLASSVSLVRADSIVSTNAARGREYGSRLQALTVGRLETEKNPLLLADVMRSLRRRDPRWRLLVCGEGPLRGAMRERLERLGLSEHVELLGYVPFDRGLLDLYRESHAFLHVSWTEGLPQVLLEAFAAGLPTVATAVGGVPESVDGAALLVPAGDPEAAAAGMARIGRDPHVRARLVEAGVAHAREHTMEEELARLAGFLTRRPRQIARKGLISG